MGIRYEIDLKERKVTAVLKGTQKDALTEIEKLVGGSIYATFGMRNPSSCLLAKEYRASAKCSIEDDFSLGFGKALAKSRCMKKYYKAKDSAIKQWYEESSKKLNNVEKRVRDIEKFSHSYKNDETVSNYLNALSTFAEALNDLDDFSF